MASAGRPPGGVASPEPTLRPSQPPFIDESPRYRCGDSEEPANNFSSFFGGYLCSALAPVRTFSTDGDDAKSSHSRPQTQAVAQREPAESGHCHAVWLHVYDLGPLTGRLNELVLRDANLGAFHCGIEVLGDEWSFQGFHDAWDDPTLSGVVRNEPRLHPGYIYRESITLGDSHLSEEEIDAVIDGVYDRWPANQYHLVNRNCVTFAEEFAAALGAPVTFPSWVRGASDAGKSPALFAIADYGWSWFKWWSKRQAEQEQQALEAEEGIARAAGDGMPHMDLHDDVSARADRGQVRTWGDQGNLYR